MRIIGSPLVVLAAVTTFAFVSTELLLDRFGGSRIVAESILPALLTVILGGVLGVAGTGALGMKRSAWWLALLSSLWIVISSGLRVFQLGPATIWAFIPLDAGSIGSILILSLNALATLYLVASWKEFRRPKITALTVSERNPLKLYPTRFIVFPFYVVWIFLWMASAIVFIDPTNVIGDWHLGEFRIQFPLGALLGLGGVAAFAYAEIRRITTGYTITDERVSRKDGIIRRNVHEVPLNKVENLFVDQGILQRALRYGDIRLDTDPGYRDDQKLHLESLARVRSVHEILSSLIRQDSSRRLRGAATPGETLESSRRLRGAATPGETLERGYPTPPQAPAALSATPLRSPSAARGTPSMGVQPVSPIPPSLDGAPVNPPAPAPWATASAEIQSLEWQVREERDFLTRLEESLVEGRIDSATYSELKRSRANRIADLERRIAERRNERILPP